MNFKVGETFKIKDEKFLVLDIFDGNPFVIALDTDIKSKFSDKNNNYKDSILRKTVDDWFKRLNVSAIRRYLDLTTMDGSKCYDFISDIKAAPLTFDEWRKYAKIIIPHLKNPFWLATAWADPKWENWGSNAVCYIDAGGTTTYNYYDIGLWLAPTFILDKRFFENNYNNELDSNLLAGFSTDALLAEVSRRVKEA